VAIYRRRLRASKLRLFDSFIHYTGWTKLNGANAVSFVVVKHVLENFDNFWQVK